MRMNGIPFPTVPAADENANGSRIDHPGRFFNIRSRLLTTRRRSCMLITMNTRTTALFCAALAAACSALSADDSPVIDLFAGWSFLPRPYYGYGYPGPYGYAPFVGVGVPLSSRFYDPLPPYYVDRFYDPYWGYDYGVRYRVWPDGNRLHTPENAQPYFPGAAPTGPLADERRTEWDLAVERFLKTPLGGECGASTNDAARATHAPVRVETR